ncbi:cellulase family glycosylhydrolase [Paenibacillus barengoltzii]|uniref:Aryl-phospho-beta-D-glucosidase BglC, GH1 family n=1 Tax=Paenibacillus barengoltzii J12 TaxID=935846 RepID=A0ABY1LZ26_9BACL|nr:cellulase family glycosylhydrolase [Paenibacillus barengoltzii]SMF38229.1 Aryl-phospho-beta-D-glucosidase BglC, GH1 family [Paenibacillus barengoltzii J12]
MIMNQPNAVRDIQRLLRTILLAMLLAAMTLSNSMFAPSAQAAEGDSSANVSRIEQSGFLKASGAVLRDNYGTGNIVNLRGTNLGGWLLQENWMSPLGVKDEWTLRETLTNLHGAQTAESLIKTYQDAWLTTRDLDNIKNMGMNMVRVPILYLELMDKYGNWKADPWSKLDWLVREAGERGIYVLLDLHGTFGAQNTFDNSGEVNSDPQLWKNQQYQDRTVRLWEGIAAHFKGNPTVAGYDLLNEPDRVSKEQLNAFYDRLYKAIRAIDPDHTIFIEAAWNWNQLYDPDTFGWTNVVYEMHYYAMSGNEASDWNAQNRLVNTALQGLRDHQARWNVPVYVGEFCLFDFTDLWEKFLAGMNASNISWTNWTYKVSSNYGNWGYFNNNPNPVPNIYSDSPETIAAKWSKFNTENFRPNTTLQNLVKKYTTGTTPSPTPTGFVYLISEANKKIVSAENAGSAPLVANRDTAQDWELFEVINNSDGTISLKSKINGKYVTADLNDGGKLIARGESIQLWEKFRKEQLPDGAIALFALANNKYVSVELNNGAGLVANRDQVGGAWEAFWLITQ